MDLIGLDVGFSATRRSSGLARLNGTIVYLGKATSSWDSRSAVLGEVKNALVTAIDAPVMPVLNNEPRSCERIFTFGLFQRRCKPGLSHVPGTGAKLRIAGSEAVEQLAPVVSGKSLSADFKRVLPGKNIIEAFPNAFLGVLLPTSCFETMPRLRRGRKFDWLYDQWVGRGIFTHFVGSIGLSFEVLSRCKKCTDHDERAALICLLTAGAVAQGRYTAVGDSAGGYFYLPSFDLWAEWARSEINRQRGRISGIEIWCDGAFLNNKKDL